MTLLVRSKDRPQMLSRALESTKGQGFDIVVALDPSAPNACYDVARKYGATLVQCTKTGLGAAWNEGMEAVRHGYVKIFDDDDILEPDTARTIKKWLGSRASDGARESLVTFDEYIRDQSGHTVSMSSEMPRNFNQLSHDMRHRLLLENRICRGSYLYHSETFDRLGPVREDLTMYEDYEWGLRARGRLLHCYKTVQTHINHATNTTNNIGRRMSHYASMRTRIELEYAPRHRLVWYAMSIPDTKKRIVYGMYRALYTPRTEPHLARILKTMRRLSP